MGETPLSGFLTSSLKALTLPGGVVRAGVTVQGFTDPKHTVVVQPQLFTAFWEV